MDRVGRGARSAHRSQSQPVLSYVTEAHSSPRHDRRMRRYPGYHYATARQLDIIGRHPHLVDAAVLVSCPCDLGPWRRHMFYLQHQLVYWLPVHSLSPMDLASEVDTATPVKVIVGDSDNVAPPELSRAYAAKLRDRHVPVTLIEIPGAPHNILLDPRVLSEIAATRYLIRRVALDHARRLGPDT